MSLHKHIAALNDLRLGVELDQHNVPDAKQKLEALDKAIRALSGVDVAGEVGHSQEGDGVAAAGGNQAALEASMEALKQAADTAHRLTTNPRDAELVRDVLFGCKQDNAVIITAALASFQEGSHWASVRGAVPQEGLSGGLTISRRSDDRIYIQILDTSSKSKFVQASVSPERFAMAVTGLSEVECVLDVRDLHLVGMKKVAEARTVECPLETFDRDELGAWLVQNCSEDGWIINASLRSQNSVVRDGDKRVLNYSVHRYVDAASNP